MRIRLLATYTHIWPRPGRSSVVEEEKLYYDGRNYYIWHVEDDKGVLLVLDREGVITKNGILGKIGKIEQ